MAKVNDNPNCPVCGDTAERELNTETNEMMIGCDSCGFCADTAIEFDTTGHYFWLEIKRYPMRQGKVHRGRDTEITPTERLCDCAVKTDESDELGKLCKAYLEASSRSAKTDAVISADGFYGANDVTRLDGLQSDAGFRIERAKLSGVRPVSELEEHFVRNEYLEDRERGASNAVLGQVSARRL